MNKTNIQYTDLSKICRMLNFEGFLLGKIESLETRLYELIPEGSELTDEALATLRDENLSLVREYIKLVSIKDFFYEWKAGDPLNYASQDSFIPQELFWMMARYFRWSGFLESLFVEAGHSQVRSPGSAAHKRLLLQFSDGTMGIYDSRIAMNNETVAEKISALFINGAHVVFAVNLDTGMADDTRLYDSDGNSYQVGYENQPVGTNRIGIYHREP